MVSVKPGEPSFRLCGTVPDILGGWMSMPLISMLFEALHGIVKCTGLDVAKWAGALAREHPAYPPVELLIRRVWGEDDPTEVTSEVIFARSTLIGRDVPYKVFKRWALRDRTPIGPLLSQWMQQRSLIRDMCCFPCMSIDLPSKQGASDVSAQVFPMRPDKICRGETQIGMEGAKVPFLKLLSPNNEGEFYVDERVAHMDKRHVVVAIDLKWLAIEGAASIYKTRRGFIAAREEACMLLAPGRGCNLHPTMGDPGLDCPGSTTDKAPMHDYWCPHCAHLNMYGTILCNGCHLPIFYRGMGARDFSVQNQAWTAKVVGRTQSSLAEQLVLRNMQLGPSDGVGKPDP